MPAFGSGELGHLTKFDTLPGPLKQRVAQSVEQFRAALGPAALFTTPDQIDQYREEAAEIALFAYATGFRAGSRRK